MPHRKTDGGTEILTQNEVHYRTGLSLDGVKGLSAVEAAAPTFARALAAERFATEFFNGGAVPPAVLKHPLTLGPDGIENLKKSLAAYRNGDKFLILEEAMEAAERLEAGMVWINNPLIDNDALPFGGWKASGLGRELGRQGLDAFRRSKMVVIDHKPTIQGWWYPYPDSWFPKHGGRKHV